ncbi:MAG: tail fiber domain-containing protein, partial [Candidatus Paceibacterota bacterium]
NNIYQQIAQASRIDQLTNTTINTPTITGGSITNTSISATSLSASTISTPTLDVTSTTATSTISTGGLTIGTNHFVVQQNSGNVGVGTTAPLVKLQVESSDYIVSQFTGTASDRVRLDINAGTSGADPMLTYLTDGGSKWSAGVDYSNSNAYVISSRYDLNQPRLTIERTNGSVGIGTTTPQWLLNPTSSTAPQLALSAGAGLAQWTMRNAGGNFYLSTTTTDGTATTTTSALTILNGGSVGIGTNNPALTLELVGNMRINSTTSTFDIFGAADGGTYALNFRSNDNYQFRFKGSADRGVFAVNPSIGNVYSNSNLELQNRSVAVGSKAFISTVMSYSDPNFNLFYPVGFGAVQTSVAGRTADFVIMVSDADNWNDTDEKLRITSGGNVGIATTTPWGLLSVNPNGIGTGPEFVVGSSTATHLIVTNSGNVGIGTTSPQTKLDIVGDIFLSDTTADFVMSDSDGGANAKLWYQRATTNIMDFFTIDDALNATYNWMRVAREGAIVSSVNLGQDGAKVGVGYGSSLYPTHYKFTTIGAIGSLLSDDQTNYEGLTITPTTGNVTLAGVTAGTGTDNINVVITPAGTGYTILNGNVGIGTTTPGALLHVAGNALFKNGTNSTTAFQVQNASASPILNIDTLNGRVGIGPASAIPNATLDVSYTLASAVNVIPTMTSATLPSGVVSASSAWTGPAWQAFDGDSSTGWIDYNNATTDIEWLSYQFTTAKTIVRYSITGKLAAYGSNSPVDWVFQGSNNGTDWTQLDSQTGQTLWTDLETRTFTFSNSVAYTTYRLYITRWEGTVGAVVQTLAMYESASNSSAFLVNNSGSVGIATTTPWGLLSVNPNGIGSGPEFVVGSSTATHLIVTNAGNVGVGTTNPTSILTVSGGSFLLTRGVNTGNTVARIEAPSDTVGRTANLGFSFWNTNPDSAYVSSILTAENTVALAFGTVDAPHIYTGAIEQMRITGIGSVGIGTTTPWAKLSVSNYSSGVSTAPLFVVASSTGTLATTTAFIIDSVGNIGIGDSTPSYQLELSTDSAGKPSTNTWTVASDARIKTDVENFTDGLSTVLNIHPVTYKYNGQGGPGYNDLDTHIGIIAQELEPIAPYMVETRTGTINNQEVTDFKTYQGHALSFILVNAIKELNLNLETLTGNALLIGGQVSSSTPTSTSFSERFFGNLFSRITTWLGEAGNGVENIFAKIINSDKVKTKEICVSNDSGETCITRTQLDTLLSNVSSSNPPSQTSTTTPTDTPVVEQSSLQGDTSTPTITILGDNPSTVTLHTSYSDMSATVTDTNADGSTNNNLGLHYNVDGLDLNQVSIDTSTTTVHTIVYSAVDSSNNWAYATRTVEVISREE